MKQLYLMRGGGLKSCCTLCLAAFSLLSIADSSTGAENMKQRRQRAAQRSRGLIFNNDGDDVHIHVRNPTVEQFLAARTTPLLGTQVSTIAYSTTRGSFASFTHRTDVGELYTKIISDHPAVGLRYNATESLIEQGTDPLQAVIDFCRQHDLEVFWSMRMNDGHDNGMSFFRSEWKKGHPEYLMGTREQLDAGKGWRVDYGHPEVRNMVFRIIEEVCQRYDIDGIELDFFRDPILFKTENADHMASDANRDALTELMSRIRACCDNVAEERGKPILISMRMPDSVDYCRAIGIDLERWLREDLMDIFVPGGRFLLNPWSESVALGRKHGVVVYPCLSDCVLKDAAARKRRQTLETYRARAMNVWAAGADGIHVFDPWIPGLRTIRNVTFESNHPLWHQIGSIDTLKGLTKHYYVTYMGPPSRSIWGPAHWLDGDRYMQRPVLCPSKPIRLQPGDSAATSIYIGESVSSNQESDLVPKVAMRLLTHRLERPGDLRIALNGQSLSGGGMDGQWLGLRIPPESVRQYRNQIMFQLAGDSQTNVEIRDLMVVVRYEQQKKRDGEEAD